MVVSEKHLNSGLHGDSECTAQYSWWLNVHGNFYDHEHSYIIKNIVMFFKSTVLPGYCDSIIFSGHMLNIVMNSL